MSLNAFYEKAIKEAKKHLESIYSLETCHKDDEDYPQNLPQEFSSIWKINIDNDPYPLNLVIAIPNTFPDKLPKIYLSKKNYLDIAPIPHVDKNRFICTRDTDVTFINDEKIGEAMEYLIRIATKEIVEKGIKKENTADFTKEFLAYWNEEADIKFLSLYSPDDHIERLKVIPFSRTFLNSNIIIAKNREIARKWMNPFKIEIDEQKIGEALYLPLPTPIPIPLPQNGRDFYKIIKNFGQKYVDAVQQYFNESPFNLIVLFSFPLNGDKILAGWEHLLWENKIFKGWHKGKKGERKYNLPLSLRLNKCSKETIKKISIERLDRERLFRRGGIGINTTIKNASIGIIGCGSLGSPLAVSLSKCGIAKFLLVDNDHVKAENVPRHICGFYEAGQNIEKSKAVKERLLKHFPDIDCLDYNEDILSLLQKDESLLNGYNLIVVATANTGVERRLSYLLRKGIITVPLVYIWLEPFGVAGQILFIHPHEGGCYQCCLNDNGDFRYSVAKQNDEFYKRECGCQSTFIPYSNLEIDHFISVVSKKIMSFLEDMPDRSLLYTWLGNLSLFKSLGYQIQDEWLADSAYTVHRKIILENESCNICKDS